MSSTYVLPVQARAKTTEQKFLDALDELLSEKSFALLTVDEIAAQAQLTRSAFLKRFGSKKQALLVLYGRYCDKVLVSIQQLANQASDCSDLTDVCCKVSMRAESLQLADFSTNRAMHELFMEKLTAVPQTKEIFRETVKLMQQIQKRHLPEGAATDAGAYAAAQLIFTINYNHVLKAMPGLPQDHATRHRLIATLVVQALSF